MVKGGVRRCNGLIGKGLWGTRRACANGQSIHHQVQAVRRIVQENDDAVNFLWTDLCGKSPPGSRTLPDRPVQIPLQSS